jgi:hypothetical protein
LGFQCETGKRLGFSAKKREVLALVADRTLFGLLGEQTVVLHYKALYAGELIFLRRQHHDIEVFGNDFVTQKSLTVVGFVDVG